MSNTYIKKFSELPVKPTTTGGEKVIINDDGVAKQVPINTLHVVKDFNQNNPDAPDYIKNRPVYVEEGVDVEFIHTTESTIWAMQEVFDSATDDQFAFDFVYGAMVKAKPITLYLGQMAYCTFDGVEYECGAYEVTSAYGESTTVIGSNRVKCMYEGAEAGILDDIPFAIILTTEDTSTLISVLYYDTLSFDHDLLVTIKQSKVHTLDTKFLPKGYPYWETAELELTNETQEFLPGEYSTICEVVTSNRYYDYYYNHTLVNYTSFGGDNVTVIWDGATYKYDDSNMILVGDEFCVGNGAMLNSLSDYYNYKDTGEQFLILVQNHRIYLYSNVEGEHSYAVYGHTQIAHKMDSELADVDLYEYLKKDDAYSRYMTKSDADYRYITRDYASTNYVSKSTFNPSNYLTTSSASSTYLTKSVASNTYLTQSAADSRYLQEIPEDSTDYETRAHAEANYLKTSDLKPADWDYVETSYAYDVQEISNKPSVLIKKEVKGSPWVTMKHNQIGFYDPKPFSGFQDVGEITQENFNCGNGAWSVDRQLVVGRSSYIPAIDILDVTTGVVAHYNISAPGAFATHAVENTRNRIYAAYGKSIYVISAIDGSLIKTIDTELPYNICSIAVSPDGNRLIIAETTDYKTFAYSVAGENFALMGELGTRNMDDITAITNGETYPSGLNPVIQFNKDGTRVYVHSACVPGGMQVFDVSGGAIVQHAQYFGEKGANSRYPQMFVALDHSHSLAYIFNLNLSHVEVYDMSNDIFDLLYECDLNSSIGYVQSHHATVVDKNLIMIHSYLFRVYDNVIEYVGNFPSATYGASTTFLKTDSDMGYCVAGNKFWKIQRVYGAIYPDAANVKDLDKYCIGKVTTENKGDATAGSTATFKVFWEIDKTERDHFVLKADNSDKKFKVMVNDAGELITSEIIDE